MRVLEGKLVDSGIKVGIVAARFNEFIVSKLVAGAKDGLVRHDVSEENNMFQKNGANDECDLVQAATELERNGRNASESESERLGEKRQSSGKFWKTSGMWAAASEESEGYAGSKF